MRKATTNFKRIVLGTATGRTILSVFLVAMLVVGLASCGKPSTNDSSLVQNIKTYISDNITYELSDLRVVSDDFDKSVVVVATLKKMGDVSIFTSFTEEVIKLADIAAQEQGAAVRYVNTIVNLTEDDFLGWTTDGSLYMRDGETSKDIAIEKLQDILLERYIYKGLYIDADTISAEEKNYIDAMKEYIAGNFEDAKILFEKQPDYKDTSKRLEKIAVMLPLQGEWENDKISSKIIIKGWEYNSIHYSISKKDDVSDIYTFQLEVNDDLSVVKNNRASQARGILKLNIDGKLIERDTASSQDEDTFSFISNSTELPTIKKKPSVGMTESEVISSNWGMPKKKNKTSTAMGTTQQWVYENGYIYFDKNGIVTAIQSR